MEQANQNQFKCSGDCLNCRVSPNERKTQWQYCAAQFTYNTMRMVETLQNDLKTMTGTVSEMRERIEAIQNSEADVFDPNADVVIEADKEENSEIQKLVDGTSEIPTDQDTAQEGTA